MNMRVELNNHPVMTVDEARASGLTASQVRTIARSLERIASKGYDHYNMDDRSLDFCSPQETDSSTNRRNAARLRAVARQM